MFDVQVISESECERGWRYEVRIRHADSTTSEHNVRLDWAEHEHWSGGRCAPSAVIEKLVGFVLERKTSEAIPARFDAATVRRWWPEVDQVLPGRL